MTHQNLPSTFPPSFLPSLSRLSGSKCCSIFSVAAIVFLCTIGTLLHTQPLYIKGPTDPEKAANACYSAGNGGDSLGRWPASCTNISPLMRPDFSSPLPFPTHTAMIYFATFTISILYWTCSGSKIAPQSTEFTRHRMGASYGSIAVTSDEGFE